MAASSEDTDNIFKRDDYDEEYWNKYLSTRPHYDQPFYQSLYDYHRAGNGSFALAHDVATGPGQVAAELSGHFAKVFASDTNGTHLDVARHRLGQLVKTGLPGSNIQLVHCPAEKLAEYHSPGSVDFIAAAECVPLFDAKAALESSHIVLKSGGTLAIWFYGRPVFTELEYAEKCQFLFGTLIDTLFSKLIKEGGPQARAGWKRVTDCMASFLDNVDLSSSGHWTDIQRTKWNSEYQMSFPGPNACDFPIEFISKIDEQNETVREVKDSAFWQRRWDIAAVRRFVSILMPAFDPHLGIEEIQRSFKALEEAMGGPDAVRDITWPVVLILARKK